MTAPLKAGPAASGAVASAVPDAVHRVLPGQTHNVSPDALAPELLEFFAAHWES
ncbi:hypothetical protein [Thermoactinospora rubra]|uniref:hypothetical protein n=1 Tax=Thermoactinospora rubra TaxID=1088767 RepID=UPI001301AE70|nr:hypothetical protein [Thermoactinospora rubra]